MTQFSFLFDCEGDSLHNISEIHPFGPNPDGFKADLGIHIDGPTETKILAISDGRLFTDGTNLLLQPLFFNLRRNENTGVMLSHEIFKQPFVFCYKGISVDEELLRSHIAVVADREEKPIASIWNEVSRGFREGTESIGVHAGEVIGSVTETAIGFEIFYISNGMMGIMPGERSGLDLIRRQYTNATTRRLDPVYFFSSIPDEERINFNKETPEVENGIFSRLTKRAIIEVRDEYDNFFIGNIRIGDEVKSFNDENHGMIVQNEVSPTANASLVSYTFRHPSHVFTQLPSGFDAARVVIRRNIKVPYHHMTQMIFMDDTDHEKNWFTRNSLLRFTESNQVKYIVDGRATFRRMVEELNKVDAPEQYVRLAGWWLQTDFNLVDNSTLESIFSRIDAVGASINVLIWDNLPDLGHCRRAVNFVNSLRNGRGILDNNDPGFLGSQHQKILIIKNRDGIVGFCGGVDINPDRLDDPSHRSPTDSSKPYHDTHAMIRGPAVRELDLTFVHRWNAHVKWFTEGLARDSNLRVDSSTRRITRRVILSGSSYSSVISHFTEYFYDPSPRISLSDQAEYSISSRGASAFVQVTRTFPQRYAREFYPFQPNGEVGTLNALKKAISRARKYIYIEDQYLYPYGDDMPDDWEGGNISDDVLASRTLSSDSVGILSSIYRQLTAHQDLVLILVTGGPDMYPSIGSSTKRMAFFVKMLRHARQNLPYDRIVFCYPHRFSQEVYVHSKLWIIDDIYVKIGSANCGRRSFTHDSEADIHVVDGALQNGYRRFAREFRKQLWKEHLNIRDRELIDDLDYALDLWQDLSSLTFPNVSYYSSINFLPNAPSWDRDIDPEGRSDPPNNPLIQFPDSDYNN